MQPAAIAISAASASSPGDETALSLTTGGTSDDAASALVRFAQDLVGVTSTEQFRTIIARELPALLEVRRVWVASRGQRGERLIVPEQGRETSETLLDEDGCEWTTFGLRIDNETIAVLGIDSTSGLSDEVKRLVRLVTPMIARALSTAQAVEALRETSTIDLVTGLATRQEGSTRLRSEVKRAQRASTAMAILMLDLDRFKATNDRYGHGVGDALLASIGKTINRTLRASDIRARWGGEEFLIVLPETDLPRAQVVATGLLREVANATVPTAEGPLSSSVSIGITISRPGETDVDVMVNRADIALYRAKAAGRGCIRVVLGDRNGQPIGAGASPSPPVPAEALPFPDRRNPQRSDRRRVPSMGRRSTDPRATMAVVQSAEYLRGADAGARSGARS